MRHPFRELEPEYKRLLAQMTITRTADVDATARRLLGLKSHYVDVSQKTGIPIAWIAASFEREASSNFRLSPAQGDRWDRVSVHVPSGRGPFSNWTEAALDAYHIDGTDKVGAANFTMPRGCYEDEEFNGFGYRAHGVHSSYLWGGTNIQQQGKYVSDGHWDPHAWDYQLGTVPMMVRMVQLDPSLALPGMPGVLLPPPVLPPMPPPIGVGGGELDTKWIQAALNRHGADPQLIVDGSYGRLTKAAVRAFQAEHELTVDGLAGPQTIPALEVGGS